LDYKVFRLLVMILADTLAMATKIYIQDLLKQESFLHTAAITVNFLEPQTNPGLTVKKQKQFQKHTLVFVIG